MRAGSASLGAPQAGPASPSATTATAKPARGQPGETRRDLTGVAYPLAGLHANSRPFFACARRGRYIPRVTRVRLGATTVLLLLACGGGGSAPEREGARTPARTAAAIDAGGGPTPASSARPAPPAVPSSPVAPVEPPADPPDPAAITECADSVDVAIFRSPRHPHPGQPLRIVVVAEQRPPPGTGLAVLAPGGARVDLGASKRGGGPPFWWSTTIDRPAVGPYKVALGRGAEALACEVIRVGNGPVRPTLDDGIWPSAFKWERDTENLYSTWIEQLFDAGVDETLSFRPLHQALRDPARNFLHGHLGLDEDAGTQRPPLVIAPDCADTSYALRAYFAWKMQLPFRYRQCNRGSATAAPRCPGDGGGNEDLPENPDLGTVPRFGEFLRKNVFWNVHSGGGRTLPDDDRTDLYPLPLRRDALRPGAVYADPYGHFLILTRWVDQTPTSSGILFAIDGQPDGSIGRKRFWRGNFLFHDDLRIAGAGWKWFRPIAMRAGELRPLTNREIARDPQYANYSDEQYRLGVDGFYDRMDQLLNPQPIDPARAVTDLVDALQEQLEARVRSVQNGEDYMRQASDRVVGMPQGADIFETTGAWEDYATPSRDMRVLIAIQVVLDFPDRLQRRPEAFALPPGATPDRARADVLALRDRLLAERHIQYVRTDGSSFTLTLADVVGRRSALEMAYNPNDCIETRWGATQGSPEHAPCARHAPADQRARMAEYRQWFATRTRPPRP